MGLIPSEPETRKRGYRPVTSEQLLETALVDDEAPAVVGDDVGLQVRREGDRPEPALGGAVADGHRAQVALTGAAGVRRHDDRPHRECAPGVLDAGVHVDALAGLLVIAPGRYPAV